MKIRLLSQSTFASPLLLRISLNRLSSSFISSASSSIHSRSHSTKPKPSSPSHIQPDRNSAPPPSQFLAHTKQRIGKCIIFGLSQEQTRKAGELLKILGEEWRELVAGREGYLTGRKRAGLRRQKVVWGEMDCMGHVNNVMYVRYAESARVAWLNNFGVHIDPSHQKDWHELATPRGTGVILKSIKVDYKFPMTYPDSISVFHKLSCPHSSPSLPSSQFDLDVLILSELHQRPAARCEEEIVVYDYTKLKKTGLPGFMKEAFDVVWEEQEEEKRRVEERIKEVERGVEELEVGSWRKDGAVEDLGGGPNGS